MPSCKGHGVSRLTTLYYGEHLGVGDGDGTKDVLQGVCQLTGTNEKRSKEVVCAEKRHLKKKRDDADKRRSLAGYLRFYCMPTPYGF